MTERPHPLALETYEGMLSYHDAVIASLDDLGNYGEDQTVSMHEISARSAFKTAHDGRKVAVRLIKAWHKDVAIKTACEAAAEAAIRARFGKA